MSGKAGNEIANAVDSIYRCESGRVLATLIRLLGDFAQAEEAMQDAFAAALAQWPEDGIPDNPRAWLVSAGRFRAIDRQRARQRHRQLLQANPVGPAPIAPPSEQVEDLSVPDDLLPPGAGRGAPDQHPAHPAWEAAAERICRALQPDGPIRLA